MLDYEHPGPDELSAQYDALRPDFSETGSARLPMGLNAGAQLHWLFARDPGLLARTSRIVTYPQYWGFRLTGALASDVTSLGCHTDLWNPWEGRPSSLADKLGVSGKLAPARGSAEVLGHLLPEVAAATGLPESTPVACGIHDSNASLVPHLLGRRGAFSVVSTGTWVVAMAIGGAPQPLDPARDTLVNVNAFGAPVPSARFMGGREYEKIRGQSTATPTGAGPRRGPVGRDHAAALGGARQRPLSRRPRRLEHAAADRRPADLCAVSLPRPDDAHLSWPHRGPRAGDCRRPVCPQQRLPGHALRAQPGRGRNRRLCHRDQRRRGPAVPPEHRQHGPAGQPARGPWRACTLCRKLAPSRGARHAAAPASGTA